ncbi:sigma-70 family RNA polymerase sigma factor [Romboutsia weinsteinii]|uniref:Sigma-70 family RNA polymerase sigma factor n=2 Tax=Romboutsia weinsteinii TaxID=2020949 RepID=A0A371J3M6_9FIRM|nr:sigma-70 family RNA polymerase sigma factor [Romboutsia weinsteinii]
MTKEEFVNLIEINKLSMYKFAKSILKNDVETEDAMSEAILKAYKNKGKIKDANSFKSWIMRILANECYDLIKKSRKFDLIEDTEDLNLVHIDNSESGLKEVVEKLNKEYSSVIVLYYYEDMSIKEISNILQLPEGTIKSRLSRAKSKLRVLLNEEEV